MFPFLEQNIMLRIQPCFKWYSTVNKMLNKLSNLSTLALFLVSVIYDEVGEDHLHNYEIDQVFEEDLVS